MNFVVMVTGLLVGAGLGFALLGFVAGELKLPGLKANLTENGQVGIGRRAPDFSLETLNLEKVSLSGVLGHPVVVNFWATWCGPCRTEMPLIEDAYQAYSPGAVFLAINYDEDVKLVGEFVEDLELTFPILLDPGGLVTDLYNVQGFPTTYFIDAEGIIRAVHIGSLSKRQLNNYLDLIGASK